MESMYTPLTALVLFALWAIVLALVVVVWRVREVMAGRAKINEFPGGQRHGSEAYWRANRAQANTIENLPVFAAIVLAGMVAGNMPHLFGTLALVVIAARVVQSLVHLASGSVAAVNFRALAYAVQVVCFIWMAVLVLQRVM
jgi:uncharacterized MAPEG superfamily protein